MRCQLTMRMIVWIIILGTNHKKLINQKLVPISIVILLGTSAAIVQYLVPTLRLIVPSYVFTIITLYFTIFPAKYQAFLP